jgi:16S rRNA C1402 N4-methylase RsmH
MKRELGEMRIALPRTFELQDHHRLLGTLNFYFREDRIVKHLFSEKTLSVHCWQFTARKLGSDHVRAESKPRVRQRP